MLFHGEKCRHCGSNMTEPKQVLEGPRKGQSRTICVKCGHIEYHGSADAQATRAMPQQQTSAAPTPFGQPRLFKSSH